MLEVDKRERLVLKNKNSYIENLNNEQQTNFFMKYIPTINDITKEIITYGVALVVVAFIISKSERLKKLVKDYI